MGRHEGTPTIQNLPCLAQRTGVSDIHHLWPPQYYVRTPVICSAGMRDVVARAKMEEILSSWMINSPLVTSADECSRIISWNSRLLVAASPVFAADTHSCTSLCVDYICSMTRYLYPRVDIDKGFAVTCNCQATSVKEIPFLSCGTRMYHSGENKMSWGLAALAHSRKRCAEVNIINAFKIY